MLRFSSPDHAFPFLRICVPLLRIPLVAQPDTQIEKAWGDGAPIQGRKCVHQSIFLLGATMSSFMSVTPSCSQLQCVQLEKIQSLVWLVVAPLLIDRSDGGWWWCLDLADKC